MKKIIWTIGVQKSAGNVIQDALLHYNQPNIMLLDGTPLVEGVHFTFSPDFDGTDYSDTYGYLDFSLTGGLYNTQQLIMIW